MTRALRRLDPLLRRRRETAELMDDPRCDPVALENTYRLFALVNPLVSGWRGLYRRQLRGPLRRAAAARGRATVLDIGSGGGDVARWVARRARRDGVAVSVLGIDPDPRAHAFAVGFGGARHGRRRRHRRDDDAAVRFLACSSADLVAQGRRFDAVISNHVLHHLDDEELRGLLADSAALSREVVVHNDLRRSPSAWAAWWVLTLPLARARTFLRRDGLASIHRARTPEELSRRPGAAGAGWQVARHGLFRVQVVRRPS